MITKFSDNIYDEWRCQNHIHKSVHGIRNRSFIPGKPYEKNPIAQRCATKLNLDIDLRACIEQDTQSARDLNVRRALADLVHQAEIEDFDEIIVFGSHSRQFEKGGSYFETLRRFFVIEHNRSFALHLRVDKKYQDFVEFGWKCLTLKPSQDPKVDTFIVPSIAKSLMNNRMNRL